MKPKLGRRAILRGAGAALSLPLLESLLPSKASSQVGDPKRFVALFFPNGTDQHREWNPSGTGSGYSLGDCHASLAPYKSELSILRNVDNVYVTGAPSHARATSAFLTAKAITDPAVARVGKSIDQRIADRIGPMTPLSSLQLGPTPYVRDPQDGGGTWSSTYCSNISWASDSVFNPTMQDPRAVFDRLFGGPDPDELAAERRRRYRRSIIDYALGEANALRARVSRLDQLKLDEYLTALRAVEQRIDTAMPVPTGACGTTAAPVTTMSFPDHTRIMLDLTVLALRCDITRVVTYQMDFGFGGKNFAFLLGGTRENHHGITHTNTSEATAKHRAITTWYCEQLAYFLGEMTAVTETTGTLLDNSAVLFGSGLGSGRSHSGDDMALVLAGRAQGALSPGRLVDAGGVPHDRLLLSLLNVMDVPATSFGSATAPLAGL